MDKQAELMIKMSHIGIINALEEKIGFPVSIFEKLEKLPLDRLEKIRNYLILEYNTIIEIKKHTGNDL